MILNTHPENRKEMVKAICEMTGMNATYLFTPTYAYQIGPITVSRDGSIDCEDEAMLSAIKPMLIERGWLEAEETPEAPVDSKDMPETAVPITIEQMDITMPVSGWTVAQMTNLLRILCSKQNLINRIPATIQRFSPQRAALHAKKRVAAYARVSTDEEEQLTSYEAQVDYYTRYIQSNPDWELVEVYADEGISGTNTKKRRNFNRMIEDALAGKIDRIVTKSVSRFARNTVDTLTTIRRLKDKGVGVFFEKEYIQNGGNP